MAGIRDLDTLASIVGERLSAREELPAPHKEAFADHDLSWPRGRRPCRAKNLPLESQWWRADGPHCHNLFKWHVSKRELTLVSEASDVRAA